MRTKNSKNGSALLIVMGVVAVVSIALGTLSFTARQQTHSALIARDMLKARMIAESGLNKAYNQLKENIGQIQGYSLKEDLDDGSYRVTSKTFQGMSHRSQLTSVGVCGKGTAVVAVDLESVQSLAGGDNNGDDDFQSLPYDLLVGGTLGITGAFRANVYEIHANGDVSINKQSNVSGTVTISSSGDVTWGNGKKDTPPNGVVLRPNQPQRTISPAELQAAVERFIAYAESNGAVYSSAGAIPANPPGGVALYTGTGGLMLHGSYNATIIALSGDVTVNAQARLNGPDGYPALIVLSPNQVRFNGGAVIHGAVLLPNAPLRFNGTAAIHGAVLVGQNVLGNGTADLYAGDPGQGFNLPPNPSVSDKLIITAWH